MTPILPIDHTMCYPMNADEPHDLWPQYCQYDVCDYDVCLLKCRWTTRCITPILLIDHTKNDPKIVDKFPELWPSRLPIYYTRYDHIMADGSYDVLPYECRWTTRSMTPMLPIHHRMGGPKKPMNQTMYGPNIADISQEKLPEYSRWSSRIMTLSIADELH